MIPLSSKRLTNLVAIIVGIIISKTVVLSEIAQELKDSYSSGTEDSKIKRIQRFLSNKALKPKKLYEFYIYKFLKKYKNTSNSIYIIFDHTTIQDKFVILQFSLKAGKRSIPLWYKVFRYKEDGNKDFKHIKEGLLFLHSVILPYKYQVTLLADRGFKKRFQIGKMFKDFKSGGFNLESTWSMDIHYIRMLYLCISIAYSWIITLGVSCNKNKIISVTKTLKGQQVRIYSLFRSVVKWFKRCYYSSRNDYYLKFCFTLYES